MSSVEEQERAERWYRRFKDTVLSRMRGLFTLAAVGVIGATGLAGLWDEPYRMLGRIVGAFVTAAFIALFYDIPQRRLGRLSRGFFYILLLMSGGLFFYLLAFRFLL
jgi:hypothetical protein